MGINSSRHPTMPSTKATEIKSLIQSNNVVIFSKTYCPYCKMAKEVFDKIAENYTAVELDQRPDGDEIQDILLELTGARTVPRVFVNGECLGGGSDVKALFESGKLKRYFQK
ncbi:glutaredoxin-C3 [Agrilus planipennis]|uniref:Glutaredoxin-2, mitochondrial n=1 Tax=Agrilus planipennis TaxID=224129 RepID=A0A1W4X8G7_AGRPL|nr:glutaredoxin-C3 [Agrilus planipennis]